MGKIKKTTSGEQAKYDYFAHTIVSASATRPCLTCGSKSVHKKSNCKKN